MFFVYILVSDVDGSKYIGYTEELKTRLRTHNQGKVKSTKAKAPYHIVYFEAYNDKSLALKRERKLKSSSWHKKQLFDRIFTDL